MQPSQTVGYVPPPAMAHLYGDEHSGRLYLRRSRDRPGRLRNAGNLPCSTWHGSVVATVCEIRVNAIGVGVSRGSNANGLSGGGKGSRWPEVQAVEADLGGNAGAAGSALKV